LLSIEKAQEIVLSNVPLMPEVKVPLATTRVSPAATEALSCAARRSG